MKSDWHKFNLKRRTQGIATYVRTRGIATYVGTRGIAIYVRTRGIATHVTDHRSCGCDSPWIHMSYSLLLVQGRKCSPTTSLEKATPRRTRVLRLPTRPHMHHVSQLVWTETFSHETSKSCESGQTGQAILCFKLEETRHVHTPSTVYHGVINHLVCAISTMLLNSVGFKCNF